MLPDGNEDRISGDPTQDWTDQQQRNTLREKERRDVAARIMAGLAANSEFLGRGTGAVVIDEPSCLDQGIGDGGSPAVEYSPVGCAWNVLLTSAIGRFSAPQRACDLCICGSRKVPRSGAAGTRSTLRNS